MTIAGHTFTDTPGGRICDCGRRWLDVLAAREFWRSGETDIAHQGALNEAEVAELNAEVERIWAATKSAVEA